MIRKIQTIFLLTLVFCGSAFASSEDADQTTWEESLIKGNIEVSEWFDGMAEGIDLFLAGKKVTDRVNESNVRISNSTYLIEKQGVQNETNLEVNLRLPNVEDYWQLKFSDYDETEDRGVQNTYLRQTPREKNYGATVGLFKKLGNVRTAFQPRVALKDPLEVAHSLTFESVAEVKDRYKINPKLEFFANPNVGAGIFHALNFNFQLNKKWGLSLINEGQYEDKIHTYRATNGLSFGQVLTPKTSLSYNFFTGSNNRDNYHLESYSVSIGWYHLLYKRMLDYSISPHLDFNREGGFTGVAGLNFGFGVNF
ncbi:MAG: hypothetical protein KF681_10505 [Bdellovibrionaceae bacterium]|nr:hypothetical protein [Pseudobdellovibrionaceae bacterium]